MNETSNTDKPVSAPPPKSTLHLKRPVEQGTVRQSFSHGRSKAVVVEKVKRRVPGPGESPPAAASTRPQSGASGASPAQTATAPAKPILAAAVRLALAAAFSASPASSLSRLRGRVGEGEAAGQRA